MRFEIALIPILLAGCDSASAPTGQAQPAAPVATEKGARAEIALESDSGTRATLSYKFAGRRAPDATFTGADGRDVSLSDFAGRPLLVNIWATWCAPCKAEMPTLDALAAREKHRLTVIAVSEDLEGRAPVDAFFDKANIANLEPYTDPDNILLSTFRNIALPTTILYDSDGREVWRVIGGAEWNNEQMEKLLREAD